MANIIKKNVINNTVLKQAKQAFFNKQAQNILDKIQEFVKNYDAEKINQNLIPLCNNFLKFYNKYYSQTKQQYNDLTGWDQIIKHIKNFQKSNGSDDKEIFLIEKFLNNKNHKKIRQIIINKKNLTIQLQTLLTGFKTLFLKTLNKDFVQVVVVEDQKQEFLPTIVKMNSFDGLSSFIESSVKDYQGKLQSNKNMLQRYENDHSEKYEAIAIDSEYINIYRQARRRLNKFYQKTGKPNYGEGLLLYNIQGWHKFWINNLGDVKEGFVAMALNKAHVSGGHYIQQDIKTFTRYIGQVDNITGTLLQDIQQIKNNDENELQISVKSGTAKTGSHAQLIKLIEKIAHKEGNGVQLIQQVFQKDQDLSKKGSGRRNRQLLDNNEENKEKIATLLSNGAFNAITRQIPQFL